MEALVESPIGAATKRSAPQWFVVDWHCCIGAGGEGEVYLGRSLTTFELCAVKVSSLLDPEPAAEQLRSELARLVQVAGTGVVGLLAWNLSGPRPFLVFELAKSGTLADEIRALRARGLVYHPRPALQRIREVLIALEHVHARGVAHRDVKPGNLLVFGNALKLGDFGTGRSFDAGVAPSASSQEFVGTRNYAAPEQLRGDPIDASADLYSVGCVLHELLTGRVPNDTAANARKYPHTAVLPQLDRLLESLLQVSPSLRPRSAAAARAEVEAVLELYGNARAIWRSLNLSSSPY